ncbi:TIGR03564 family F420-dependent LLM class oxidoreductase [Mycolicibacterium nivoides]|uniref:TIGR03564 family F420-dependent LLM class oxidoreductase n=1 Tax=Mycolicibacterium nivoides TaxID=2487344 RepID=UPI0008B94805|nr:TIGR03564 family F420-dependent LLM class oxidoreductase [Mycolicibacterium nivoides]MBN3507633.1 TIGR03564 family F420-dependent LLM class oxidoreductase [Mycolicibacterium septicum]SEQ22104.1 F420-dependent oxidoreductase, MSMEG_4879 family [Mycobacterium sp. 88mf]SFF40468.1 F420-dependent oxidoreductase, MSMEG_4879 family [Mycobacterium sp. 455mf]
MRLSVMSIPDPAPTLDAPQGLDAAIEPVIAADRSGFHRAWMPQLPPMAGMASWDVLTALAVAAGRTSRIGLGTGVVVAYTQHPLALARQALTTNAAAGGRLTLGIGVSHPFMVEALGHSYERPAAFLREYLEVLIPALAGEPVEHHGPRITTTGQVTIPGAPAPPVITAALGPQMLDLAGELTDGTITSWAGPKALEEHIIPRLSRAAARAGRPTPQVIAGLPVVLTDNPRPARDALAAAFEIAGQAPAYRAVLDKEGAAGIGEVCVVGDEAAVEKQLRRFADIGVTEFVASPKEVPSSDGAATVAKTTEFLASLRL